MCVRACTSPISVKFVYGPYFDCSAFPKYILVNSLFNFLGGTKPTCSALLLLPHPATSPQFCYARNVTGEKWFYDSEDIPGIEWEWR